MRCPNCQSNDWENVDSARIKPQGMSICRPCGFVSYPNAWKTKEEIFAHYRKDYSPPPTSQNIFSGERKNHFHHAFLNDLFLEWKAAGIDTPRIVEIGAAFGMTLNWIKQIFPKAEIYGTELTTSKRRVAAHSYGIRLDEDFDDTKKYDLIMSYKVLEHQLDPDLELSRYQKALKPSGRLYMSVPTWFDSLINFGLSGFDLECYYDKNHINVWTRKIFEGMLAQTGFEVVKKDTVIYSSTYLCKTNDSLIGAAPVREDLSAMKKTLETVRTCYMLSTENRYQEAIALYPDYPHAWIQLIEMTRKNLQDKGWAWFKENMIEKFIAACPDSPDAFITATDFAMRAEQWSEAIKYCEKALLTKPESPVSLHAMCNIMRELAIRAKDPKEQKHYFEQARNVATHLRQVSTQHFREATDLIFLFDSHLAFKGESKSLPASLQLSPVKGPEHVQPEASL
jgi:SAM-dependent methyltransferase